jgi:hypothetical protein
MKQIVLLTDFGLKDQYVGILKGVIFKISPEIRIIDLTHSGQSQNIKQAAFILNNSFKYFNEGSIFLSIIDPGVGSERRAIAIQSEKYFFIAPDNGLLSYILENEKNIKAVELTNEKYFLNEISNTFHGRDIFAPVAAHFGNGVSISQFGNYIDTKQIIKLKSLQLELNNSCITAEVIYSDNFGNLITSISANLINSDFSKYEIIIDNIQIKGIYKTYSEVKPGELLAYIGSSGYLEIGINKGNLAQKLKYYSGSECIIKLLFPVF